MTTIIGQFSWGKGNYRIEWEATMGSWVVRKENPTTGEWDISTGLIPVNEVAVMLGAPRKIKCAN